MMAGLLIAGSYLLGAIPFGLLLARAAGVDVRAGGSGNIGATNVARTAGRGLGVLTLVLDALKGAGPVWAAQVLDLPVHIQVAVGLAAVVGHVFPVYLAFRGGKGVATGAGVFLALTPPAAGVSVVAFALVYVLFRVVSVASLFASLALVGATVFLDGRPPVIGIAALVAALIFVRHTGNLRRLMSGAEPKGPSESSPGQS